MRKLTAGRYILEPGCAVVADDFRTFTVIYLRKGDSEIFPIRQAHVFPAAYWGISHSQCRLSVSWWAIFGPRHYFGGHLHHALSGWRIPLSPGCQAKDIIINMVTLEISWWC